MLSDVMKTYIFQLCDDHNIFKQPRRKVVPIPRFLTSFLTSIPKQHSESGTLGQSGEFIGPTNLAHPTSCLCFSATNVYQCFLWNIILSSREVSSMSQPNTFIFLASLDDRLRMTRSAYWAFILRFMWRRSSSWIAIKSASILWWFKIKVFHPHHGGLVFSHGIERYKYLFASSHENRYSVTNKLISLCVIIFTGIEVEKLMKKPYVKPRIVSKSSFERVALGCNKRNAKGDNPCGTGRS